VHWNQLVDRLFPQGHDITADAALLRGTGRCGATTFCVIGSTDHVAIGVEQALAMAHDVLATIIEHPLRPILFLVDTQGQRLRRRDEILGLNHYMGHLAQCVELARQRGHTILALVYDQALSGGFLATGMMADLCAALPEAEIRVMGLPAMARVTRLAEEHLQRLAATSPVFAPGADNYLCMGAIENLWEGDLAAHLTRALAAATTGDTRRALGLARGGRLLAAGIVDRIVATDVNSDATVVATAN
jgi:malonate decarboxylase gamma subunit